MTNLKILTQTALLLALTLAVQSLKFPTVITGPLVNFMLILATIVVGVYGGVAIGLLTPWIALMFGILPALLAPAVPFIMLGNAIYCFLFGLLQGRSTLANWLGIAAGAVVKFAVIAGAATAILSLPSPLVEVLLFPQLINALIGGIAALTLGFYLKKILKKTRRTGILVEDDR